jgi:hypothetical protein
MIRKAMRITNAKRVATSPTRSAHVMVSLLLHGTYDVKTKSANRHSPWEIVRLRLPNCWYDDRPVSIDSVWSSNDYCLLPDNLEYAA